MEGRLGGIGLKLNRAHLNLCELDTEIRAWFNGDSHDVAMEVDDEGWVVFTVTFHTKFSANLGVIVGDYVHNLRSALDHLVWQLCIINDQTPDRHLQFPIFDHLNQWIANVEKRDPKRGPHPLEGLEASHIEMIKRFQPFAITKSLQDAQNTPLAILNSLSNTDKHQTLHVITAVMSDRPLGADFIPPDNVVRVDIESFVEADAPLEGEIKIARARAVLVRGTKTQPIAHLKMPIGVLFGERKIPFGALMAIEQDVFAIVSGVARAAFLEVLSLPKVFEPTTE